MIEILVNAMQLLAAMYTAFGVALCVWHDAVLSVAAVNPAQDERDSAFTFMNANDFEIGYRSLAIRRRRTLQS